MQAMMFYLDVKMLYLKIFNVNRKANYVYPDKAKIALTLYSNFFNLYSITGKISYDFISIYTEIISTF